MKSILQSEKRCYITGSTSDLERHHIFGAANRDHSEEYGLTVWLRHDWHNEPPYGVHHNKVLMDRLHKEGQLAFERTYPELNFMEIFGRNYL